MNQKKVFVALLAILAIGIVGYFILVKNQTSTPQTQQIIFASQEECEQKTGKSCTFQMCDYVPPGKTFEEVCGKDFKKGWVSTTSPIQNINQTNNQQSNGSDQIKSLAFTLDFSAGGSIFGSSFEVKISGDQITYRKTTQGVRKEVLKMDRSLLPNELTDIQKTIVDAKIVTLQSQDFTKEPLVPDQASYRITVSLDGKENTIHCGIPLSGTKPTTNCQKQIDKLRLKLNSMLGVNIY
ncbi:MAG: hypothetical protein Q7R65_01185 [bacterium]|nr:hypothetical protein [bacterium]